MKKILSLALTLIFLATTLTPSSFAKFKGTICIDDMCVSSDVSPYIEDGTTMVAIRLISEALGYDVDWDSSDREVKIEYDNDNEIRLKIDSIYCEFNGKKIKLAKAATVKNGRTFVALRTIAELMGKEVNYEQKTKSIEIYS